jgi:ABC-type sugar transport system substrate-binding protein
MYAGAEYARAHGDKTTQFIAGDYSTEVATAIKHGAVYGTVDQSPGVEGQLGVQYGYDILTGKTSAVPAPTSDIPLPIVTKKNVNSIPALWNS